MTSNKTQYNGWVESSLFGQGGYTNIWEPWEKILMGILSNAVDEFRDRKRPVIRKEAAEFLRSDDAASLAEFLDFSEGLERYLLEQKLILPLFLAIDDEPGNGPIFIATEFSDDGQIMPIFQNYGELDLPDNRV